MGVNRKFGSLAALSLTAALLAIAPATATAADVAVSIQVGQPGFYGRIDVGALPAPPVIYQQPIVVMPAPMTVAQRPIYLRVPPGHAKKWDKHCHRYNACGQQTYFVTENWYSTVYAPAYHHHHDRDRRGAREERHGHGKHGHRKHQRD